jgi:hypothetical protein
MRWVLWYLLAPQAFLVLAMADSLGSPALDGGVLIGLFLVVHAEVAALPWLLLGAAMGRAVVDEASLATQILVLGVPVALLLPLRAVLESRRWVWQMAIAAVLALVLPELAALLARWTGNTLQVATASPWAPLVAACYAPLLLGLLRWLPPFQAFEEER